MSGCKAGYFMLLDELVAQTRDATGGNCAGNCKNGATNADRPPALQVTAATPAHACCDCSDAQHSLHTSRCRGTWAPSFGLVRRRMPRLRSVQSLCTLPEQIFCQTHCWQSFLQQICKSFTHIRNRACCPSLSLSGSAAPEAVQGV